VNGRERKGEGREGEGRGGLPPIGESGSASVIRLLFSYSEFLKYRCPSVANGHDLQ